MGNSNFVDYVKLFLASGDGGNGSTHMRREKYITISITAETIEDAVAQFARFDGEISNSLKKM